MTYEWTIAPTTTERGGVFDQAYNTLQPKPDQSQPAGQGPQRDFGERPEAPRPGGQPGLSPNNVFDDAYNLLPPRRPGDAPEGPFDSRFNNLNKPSDFPAFKGRPQPFNQNGEIGKLYVDERSGFVLGMEFNEGSKKGQKYVFDRDAQGNISKMHILMPGKDGAPPNYLIFDKTDKGWVSKPAGQSVPGFRNLESQNGAIVGDFKVNAKGDFSYESKDKQTKHILRLNGDKDLFNMREYSRERESLNGQKATTFWNGYEWLPGQKEQVGDGVTKVTFQTQRGKPAWTIRDAKTNGFQVEFTAEKTAYKVDNWHDGKMNRTQNGATDTIYTTGSQDAQGKLQWRKGQEKVENGQRVVTFNDTQDTAKIRAGELPQGSIIDPRTGEVTSVYANGTQVRSNNYGVPQRITYKNQQYIEVVHDTNNDFRGFRRSDGTVISKGPELSSGSGAAQGSSWIVQRPGQQPVEFNGTLKHGNGGAFNILNAGNEGLNVNPDGVLSTKVGGKEVSDSPQTTPPAPRPGEQPAPVRPGDQPVVPRPGDKPPGKSNVTDDQLKALAAKYKVNLKVLAQAKERAEKQGMHQSFTPENLDKLLQLADKHKLVGDFTDKGVSAMSRPGAIVGKLIPELLADPDSALAKLQAQMKESLEKSLKDSGAQQPAIARATSTVDTRFAFLKTSTQPFVAELKTALATRPPVPGPVPGPVPAPQQR